MPCVRSRRGGPALDYRPTGSNRTISLEDHFDRAAPAGRAARRAGVWSHLASSIPRVTHLMAR